MINFTGLGSGLDIAGLVDSLVAAERAGSDFQLDLQSAKLQSKFSALGALKSALSTFQSSLSGVASFSTYNKATATSSDSSLLGVSADSNAIANDYAVEISQLASSHSLASSAVLTADTTALGNGTITIRFGTTDYDKGSDTYNSFTEKNPSNSVTIAIDDNNNTLEGIMTAINAEDTDVKASIINDGSGYRLIFTSAETGVENSLQVTVDDDDNNDADLNGLSLLAFNDSATNLEQTVVAQDADLLINGLSVTHSSNTVDSAIEGITLSLNQISASPIQVSVKPDTEAVKSAVSEFISGYNQFVGLADSLSAYNPDSRQAAALVGDFTLRSIEGQINSLLRSSISIPGADSTSLVALGITTTASGTLTIDDAKFDEVLADEPERVIQMFTAFGIADDPGISYLGSSNATVAGEYGIEITSLAVAGDYEGASVLPTFVGSGQGNNVLIDQDNDNLTLAIDGVEAAEITLTQDLYLTGELLAEELQTQINAAAAFVAAGVSVSVTYSSVTDNLLITSDSLGSTSTVNITAVDTDTAATLGLDVGSGNAGTDITGLIDGVAATVTGNIMTAAQGTNAEGLRLEMSGTTIGSRGNLNFTKGIASQLDSLFDQLLNIEGALSDRIESTQTRLEDVEDRREQLELRWETIRDRYTNQFNALDSLLGQLQNTSTFLEQQLGGLLEPNTGRDSN